MKYEVSSGKALREKHILEHYESELNIGLADKFVGNSIGEDYSGITKAQNRQIPFEDFTEQKFDHSQLTSVYIFTKGVLERLVSTISVILLSPLMAIIALIIRIDSQGNPIFAQERIGKNGRSFTAYKFRTMYANNDDSEYKAYLKQYILKNEPYKIDQNGKKIFKLVNDPRITRVGAILRKTNLDELPQLINIIKGEMVLIGPRPDVPFSVNMYGKWPKKRLAVTPGITGLWQVCNRKGLTFDDMVRLDIEYIGKISPLMDIKIFFLTIRTLLIGDGS